MQYTTTVKLESDYLYKLEKLLSLIESEAKKLNHKHLCIETYGWEIYNEIFFATTMNSIHPYSIYVLWIESFF